MSKYLARFEITDGFTNIRPVMELLEDGFVEVDEEKFGRYGNISIRTSYNFDNPLIQDQKYCIFTISDTDYYGLESNLSGVHKIGVAELLPKCKSVDTSSIRELIELPTSLTLDNLSEWIKLPITIIATPITKQVYLADNDNAFGPFTWRAESDGQFVFTPSATEGDPYTITSYKQEDFFDYEPIYTFDAEKRVNMPLYGQERHLIRADKLPDTKIFVDCIDDNGLKEYVGRLLAQSAETKREKHELRSMVEALPSDALSAARKQKIEQLIHNGELSDQEISSLVSIALRSESNVMDPIIKKILENANYSDKVLELAKRQPEYQEINDNLIKNIKQKESDLKALNEKVEQLRAQPSEEVVSSKEMQELEQRNYVLSEELAKYRECEARQKNLSELEARTEKAKKDYDEYSSFNLRIQDQIRHKIESAYVDFAFDGVVANLLLQEAAQFEKQQKRSDIVRSVAKKENISDISSIQDPKALVDFLYQELTEKAHRAYSKNDIANILICLSQGFLTILAGEPGTGKTSLVSLLSRMLGLVNPSYPRYTEVAVEKGWTSRRDLIGYYNPLTKAFDATNKGLFNALSTLDEEAKESICDFPYIVLLDEANLSQMEHYWADFMSLADFDKATRKLYLSDDYVLDIPETLRFIATINFDHTTEILSPRLIDRAWVLKMPQLDIDIADYIEPTVDDSYSIVAFDVLQQLRDSKYWKSDKLDDAIVEKFTRIRTLCKQVGVYFSPRVIAMIKRYCLAAKGIMDYAENSYTALDFAISQKVLPMINGYGEPYQKFIEEMMKECDQSTMPYCYEQVSAILKGGASNMQYYQYFSR